MPAGIPGWTSYDLKAPNVTVLSDKVEAKYREIEYEIKTNRQAEEIIMQFSSKVNVSKLQINGKEVEQNILNMQINNHSYSHTLSVKREN